MRSAFSRLEQGGRPFDVEHAEKRNAPGHPARAERSGTISYNPNFVPNFSASHCPLVRILTGFGQFITNPIALCSAAGTVLCPDLQKHTMRDP